MDLNDNVDAVGAVYRYALKVAGVTPSYFTEVNDPGILICPREFPLATLYVITSESNQRVVSFRDRRSNKEFSEQLDPGRVAPAGRRRRQHPCFLQLVCALTCVLKTVQENPCKIRSEPGWRFD